MPTGVIPDRPNQEFPDTLSEAQEYMLGAASFDFDLRCFAGPAYSTLRLSGYPKGGLPLGWTSLDTPPAGWTEITRRVSYDGQLEIARTGSSVAWTANLRGVDYDNDLLGVGKSILMMRQHKQATIKSDVALLAHYDHHALAQDSRGQWIAPSTLSGGYMLVPGVIDYGIQMAPAATNLLSNPSFEAGTVGALPTGWTYADDDAPDTGSLVKSYTRSQYGSFSGLWTCTDTDNASLRHDAVGTFDLADPLTGSIWVFRSSWSKGIVTLLLQRTDTYATLASTTVDMSLLATGGWHRFSAIYAGGGSGTAGVTLRLKSTNGAAANSFILYLDGAQIEAGSRPTPYLDGSLGTGHAWNGTVHASTSTRTACRLEYAATETVYDPGVNLVSYPSLEHGTVGARPSGWVYGDANTPDAGNFTKSADQALFGSYSGKLALSGAASAYAYANTTATYDLSLPYTASIWIYVDSWSSGTLTLRLTKTDSTVLSNVMTIPVSTLVGAGWKRYSVTYAGGGTGLAALRVILSASSTGHTYTVYVDGAQIEQRSYLTPYFDGSTTGCDWTGTPNFSTSTRDYYQTPVVSPQEGTAFIRWIPACASNVGEANEAILNIGSASSNGSLQIFRYYNQRFYARVLDSVGVKHMIQNVAVPWATGDSMAIAVTWKSGVSASAWVYRNGVKVGTGTVAIDPMPDEWSGPISVGYGYANSSGNGVFDEFCLFDRALSEAEVTAMVAETEEIRAGGNWGCMFVGEVTTGGKSDTYARGGEWERKVVGPDNLLRKNDAPPLSAGPISLQDGATIISDSGDLANVALEVPNEAAAVRATFVPENVIDGDINTAWVSSVVPTMTALETWPSLDYGNAWLINEIAFKAPDGYSQGMSWWFEVINIWRETRPTRSLNIRNGIKTLYLNMNMDIPPESLFIVCSDRQMFERVWGGANFARHVVAVNEIDRNFQLSPTEGYVSLYSNDEIKDTVVWMPNGATPYPPIGTWTGPALNSTALPAGQTYRRNPMGNHSGANPQGSWSVEPYPTPGYWGSPLLTQWVTIKLPEHDTALTQTYTAGNSYLYCNTTGWPASGNGLCEAETFAYSAREVDRLRLTTPMSGEHVINAPAWPLDQDMDRGGETQQSGWPLSHVIIRRFPGKSVIKDCRVFVSQLEAPDGYADGSEAWKADYYPLNAAVTANTNSDILVPLAWNGKDYRFVRSIMVCIDEMSDLGRAKINEVIPMLSQATINASGLADLDTVTSYDLAKYFWTYCGRGIDEVSDDRSSSAYGRIGAHQTAILPYYEVFDALAASTGTVAHYDTDGRLHWEPDPWWPGGATTQPIPLTDAQLAGTIRYDTDQADFEYLVLNGSYPDGITHVRQCYPRTTTNEPPAGARVREVSDVILATPSDERFLVEALFRKEHSPAVCRARLKGVGDFLRPGHRFIVEWDWDGSGTDTAKIFVADYIVTTWLDDGQRRTVTTDIEMTEWLN